MTPILGQIVYYRSKVSGATLAAIVTGTQDTLLPEGIASGGVDPLDSPTHLHLHVFTPGRFGHGRDRAAAAGVDTSGNVVPGGYQEFNIPQGDGPGTWSWPVAPR